MTLGHNSVAADELKLLLERVDRLEEERKSIADDIRDVWAEGKARGYDVKILRQLQRLRKMEQADRMEARSILETYAAALGIPV